MALAVPALTGCELLDAASQNSSCVDHGSEFSQVVSVEGALSEDVSLIEPYPMAMVISQPAINELFAAAAGANLPDIPLHASPGGIPVSVTIHPALPLLQVGGESGCSSCLLTDAGFGLTFDVAGVTFGGAGSGRYQFPLFMQPQGLESTSVVAQFADSTVLSLDLHVNGVDDFIIDFFEPLISDAVTHMVREDYGDTTLFDMKAWELGDGDVKLLGRGPHVEPETQTIVIGMHSNLVRNGASSNVDWNPLLPEGADIGLQFHPALVEAMVGRMMHEGHIPRSYDSAGQASAAGDHQVTLSAMSATGSGLMTTGFRLWRTSGGFCGFADLQADLGLSISDKRLAFSAQNVSIGETAGAGNLLQYADSWVGSDYLSELISVSEITVNYNEIDVPGGKRADMSAESFQLNLDASGLSLFLNIDAIVDAVVD